jgi:hypothetical protein
VGRGGEQASECTGPKWRPVVKQECKGETAPFWIEKEEPLDGSDVSILLQEVISFL